MRYLGIIFAVAALALVAWVQWSTRTSSLIAETASPQPAVASAPALRPRG